MRNLFKAFVLLALAAAAFYGCARPSARCTSPEDNPRHHYLAGMDLLEQDKVEDAAAKFDRAIYCDSSFGPAHGGMAMVEAARAGLTADEAHRKLEVEKSFDQLKSAYKNAETPEDEFAYRLASMRVYTALRIKGWLGEAEDDYKAAMKLKTDDRKLIYYDGREAASYFMGLAYIEAREFQLARDRFSDVLNAKKEGKWNAPADREWKRVDKIVSAMGGITLGDVGKEIALMGSVKRADMAALIADELKIDRLFAGRIPVKSEIDRMKPGFVPADVASNPFKEEILTMMKWGVRGFEPVYDEATRAYLFKPGEPLTRKDFAFVLEDILIKITGDEKMAGAYFGHEKSPFPDVPATSAWYNAIMNVTTRNIMETELSGEFRPNDSVDGAEAVLAVRVLRQRLNIY
ncbi:MAG: S-layer homology domain-containing protein [Deltaproteobacteria bacterium]|nr:S-layer homology domain-containing protein [Deltaproteobacteria bacterium]